MCPAGEAEPTRRFLDHYSSGRQARLSGDLHTALRKLASAVRTIPSAEVDAGSRGILFTEIGLALKYLGRPREAVTWYRLADATVTGTDPDHPLLPDIEHNLGGALLASGDPAAAEPHARRAVTLRQRLHPGDHDGIAADEVALAGVLISIERTAEAEPLLTSALDHFTRTGGLSCEAAASALHNLAAIEARRGRLQDALVLQARCLAIRTELHGPTSPYSVAALANLGRIQLLAGDRAGARTAFSRAAAILDNGLDPDHPVAARVREGLAAACG